MTKKRKIIDIIFFNGQIDMLKFRLTELNPFIDTFIIIECLSNSSESMLVKHSQIFDNWKQKFIHLYAPVNFICPGSMPLRLITGTTPPIAVGN